MKKNIIFTFGFSFIPGAGQMYQGYMKRGLSIMLLTGFFIALAMLTATDLFTIPIPIIMAYSFFDTFNIRNKFNEKENGIEIDKYIWNTNLFDGFGKINFSKKNYFLGILLILVGIYIFTNQVLYSIARIFDIELFTYISRLANYIPPIIIAVGSIYCGIKLINRK